MAMATKVQNQSTKHDLVIEALPVACSNERAAVEFMEKQRWGDHPACPRCGDLSVYQMKDAKTGERQANYRWRCHGCKQQFTVRIGTVFEESRIELRHWCFAFWRASTSKKGVSALEIHRQTGVSYKSALFMLHRIRFAMNETVTSPLGGTVEVDEVYIGGKARHYNGSRKTRPIKKTAVLGLIERGGRVRPRVIADVTAHTLKSAIRENVAKSARIYTDEYSGYRGIGAEFEGGHDTVRHSTNEYARGDVHTNSIEGFFGMLRRGIDGIYHNVSHKHLHRYLSEFEFRHNYRHLGDGERTLHAIRSANHKRLTYAAQVNGE
jgi:transposase-like protein